MTEVDASQDTPGGSVKALVTSPALAGHLKSWVGDGENLLLTPMQVTEAIGAEQLKAFAADAGTDPATLAKTLAEELPHAVDQLSPDGQIVTDPPTARHLLDDLRLDGSPGKLSSALNLNSLLNLNPLLSNELISSLINIQEIVDKDLGDSVG